jgi:hypothetical protein
MPLRHRYGYAADHSPQPPRQLMPTAPGVPHPTNQVGAHRLQPTSTRFELAPNQGTVTRRFLAYSSPTR